jgi:ubiquitin carboxyl-terminal hydrolase 5/13
MRTRILKKKTEDDKDAPEPVVREAVCPNCHVLVESMECAGPFVPSIIEALSTKKSAATQDTIDAQHLMNLKMDCPHQHSLVKVSDTVRKATDSPCDVCGLTGNCWLCLACGHVGCGREDTGGKGHARAHSTSASHPIVVKLGTITPTLTADVWCYACSDDILDYQLREHLLWYGIDPSEQVQTVKTLREMELDMNSKFDFNKITEEGKELVRCHGPGFTGLENLGNTCYMASALQVLFASMPFAMRYHFSEYAVRHQVTCNHSPSELECQVCQIIKIAHGMYSGLFSKKDGEEEPSGITPRQFKKIWSKGNEAFSGPHQQDVDEYLRFFLQAVSRLEKGVLENDPSKAFEVEVETRRECDVCKGVAYDREVMHTLPITIPITPPPIVIDEKTGKPVHRTPEEIEASRPKIHLMECLATMLQSQEVERTCTRCQATRTFTVTRGVSSFPPFLLLTAQRFCWDRALKAPRKLDVNIEGLEEPLTDFGMVRANEHTPGEFILAREAPIAEIKRGGPPVDEMALVQVVSMGIDQGIAEMALRNTDNNVERAIEWVFSHPDAVPDAGESAAPPAPVPAAAPVATEIDQWPATYELYGLLSHIGQNTGCGHYVAHLKKEEAGWVMYNDSKVAKSQEPPFGLAYVYAFRRKYNRMHNNTPGRFLSRVSLDTSIPPPEIIRRKANGKSRSSIKKGFPT